MLLYWILLPIVWPLLHILWRIEVVGKENIPRGAPMLSHPTIFRTWTRSIF